MNGISNDAIMYYLGRKRKQILNDDLFRMVYFSDLQIFKWLDSRKGHKKARWLRKINRALTCVNEWPRLNIRGRV